MLLYGGTLPLAVICIYFFLFLPSNVSYWYTHSTIYHSVGARRDFKAQAIQMQQGITHNASAAEIWARKVVPFPFGLPILSRLSSKHRKDVRLAEHQLQPRTWTRKLPNDFCFYFTLISFFFCPSAVRNSARGKAFSFTLEKWFASVIFKTDTVTVG